MGNDKFHWSGVFALAGVSAFVILLGLADVSMPMGALVVEPVGAHEGPFMCLWRT